MVLVGGQREPAVAGGGQQTRKTKDEESKSSVTVEHGSCHNSKTKEITEVKDRWVKVRVTMDSGAAGHVMPETMFPRVKLERKASPKTFVAANGEQIRDLGEKRIPFKTKEGTQRSITFRSANIVELSHLNAKSSPSWKRCRAG